MTSLLIRASTEEDLPHITSIYAWNVLHGSGTFELEPPSLAKMEVRRADVLAKGLPWLVASQLHAGGEIILGYAYADYFRLRPAYRFCVEDSIYLADTTRGKGVGKALLAELIAQCQTWGARQMLAVIGDTANAASIGLHRSLGFEHAGVLKSSGWKFDAWRDVVLMQRALGAGDTTSPKNHP